MAFFALACALLPSAPVADAHEASYSISVAASARDDTLQRSILGDEVIITVSGGRTTEAVPRAEHLVVWATGSDESQRMRIFEQVGDHEGTTEISWRARGAFGSIWIHAAFCGRNQIYASKTKVVVQPLRTASSGVTPDIGLIPVRQDRSLLPVCDLP